MKKLLFVLSLSLGFTTMQAQEAKSYGEVKVQEDKAISGDALMNTIKELKTSGVEIKDVTISGPVNEVCQAKGCWMTLKLDDGQNMTVKFKDYAFFMPMDCMGRKFTAHGRMFIKETSVAELRHLAEDAGRSKKQIKKIKKAKKEVRFEADGVILA
jgi:Domain of unknown function (DUF4920)